MRRNKLNIAVVIIFILIIGGAFYYVYPFESSINLGLDLRGGTQLILKATQAVSEDEDPEEVTSEAIDKAMLIILDRVDRLGISEPLVTKDYSDNIVIQLPGVDDPDRAIEVIGKTAQLEFRIVEAFDPVERTYDIGPVLFTGDRLSKSNAGYDSTGSIVVFLSFTSEGARIFEEVTAQNIGRQLAIVLDGEVKSAPVIRSVISGGDAVIEGVGSLEDARDIALVLETGALPVNLVIEETRTVESTLGRDALTKGIYAGIIGFALIIIFMIAYYRGLGLVSIIGLLVYIFIFWGVLGALGAALTLPGIAGIILTIGMAVDANIIIYERIREELRKGKTPFTALNAGFKNAMRTIIDANVTTLITAAALFRFGTGPVRGFAVTLGLGVIISMITAIILVRSILYLLATNKKIMRPGFFGIKKIER